MRRARLKAVSDRRRRRDAAYPAARAAVWERSSGCCEARTDTCTGRAEQVHHRAGRGGPDPHRLSNLLAVCAACHRWIEHNRAVAYERGWLVRRNGGAA